MSTILTVPAERVWTEPRPFTDADWRKVTRAVYSIDGYSPVRVAIHVGETVAIIKVVSLPGGSWWRAPSAAQRRRLLDEVLLPLGLRREPGKRVREETGIWVWHYDIVAV